MNKYLRIFLILISIIILGTVYLLQNYPLAQHLERIFSVNFSENLIFIINKTARVLINDNAAILLIYALFIRKEYVKLAFYVQLFEVFLVLPLYFILKLSIEGTSELSSPLLQQIHRLIVNPTLMILLIFGFIYQDYVIRKKNSD